MSRLAAVERSEFARGALTFSPMAVAVAAGAPTVGLAAAVGALPVALLGPGRGGRRGGHALPALAGALMLVAGALLGALPTAVTVAGLGVCAYLIAGYAQHGPFGPLTTAVLLPFFTAGTGIDAGTAPAVALVLLVGGLWAALVALRGPARPRPATRPATAAAPAAPAAGPYRDYRLTLAAGTAATAAVGAVIGAGHPGWAPTALAVILRPQRDLTRLRGLGRLAGTVVGVALASLLFTTVDHHPAVLAAAVLLLGVLTVGLRTTDLAVLPVATTTYVLLLLAHAHASVLRHEAGSRLVDNAIAFVVALVLTPLVPALVRFARRPGAAPPGGAPADRVG